jgi:hypothetical protein
VWVKYYCKNRSSAILKHESIVGRDILYLLKFFPANFPVLSINDLSKFTDISMWSKKNKVFWFECKIQISGFRSHLLTYCWWYFSPAKKMKIISACIWLSIIFAFMSIWPWFEYIRQKPRTIFIINSHLRLFIICFKL